MEGRRDQCTRIWVRILRYFILVLLFTHCYARKSILLSKDATHTKNKNIKRLTILELAKNLNMVMDVSMKDSSNPQPYVSSPFTLPPYDSLAPIPFPDNNNNPPYCVYPPPQSPSTTMPNPIGLGPSPPSPTTSNPNAPLLSPPPGPPETLPSPPYFVPGPPDIITPGPPEYVPSPSTSVPNPPYYEPSPPSGGFIPSPPDYVPSPVGFEPSPPVFQPPVVFPTPPPPASSGGAAHVWCVAKPTVPGPILQEAMNYACGSGADCDPIQPSGSCYQPNSILNHASYAFNSYWQRTKVAGGTCEFGGTAMLVTMDPSSGGCKYVTNF